MRKMSAASNMAKAMPDEDDDAWMADAPKQDYLDSAVNSYRHLADDQQPWFKAKQRMDRDGVDDTDDLDGLVKRTFSLRVRNLPIGMDQNGLINLFSKHGKVLEVTIIST